MDRRRASKTQGSTARHLLPGAVVVGFLLLLSGAQAHIAGDSNDHGSITVDVDDSTDPCLGTVHLSELDFQNGTVEMNIVRGGSAPDLTLEERTFNGTAEEGGFAATLTGFEMHEGWDHYFVVEFDAEEYHSFRSDFIRVDNGDCGDPEDEPCFEVELVAKANNDSSITLTAQGLDKGQEAELWKSSFGESAEEIATLTPQEPTFTDTDTEAGTSYFYSIFVENDSCDRVEVTAIPFFPSAWAGVSALVATTAAYVALRRR